MRITTIDAAIAETFESLRARGDVDLRLAAAKDRFATLAVDELLKLTADCLMERSRWPGHQGAAIARQLLDRFDANCYRWEPAWLLAVADAALFIARSSDHRTPSLLFRAYKERANALRTVSRFEDAFRSLDEAEEYANDTYQRELHAAVLAWNRASVHLEMCDTDAALSLLHEAQEGFLACHDIQRLDQSRAMEGATYWAIGRYDDARRLFETAVFGTPVSADPSLAAMQLGNIGLCLMSVGDNRDARNHLERAARTCTAVPRAKMLVGLGRLAIRERGADGVAVMEEACSELERLGMPGDWAFARLHAAEELLTVDASADVSHLCREAYDRFLSLGMTAMAERMEGTLKRRGMTAPIPA